MTVVRRELPPSKGASRPGLALRRRIVSARALQSCPHHAGAAAPQKVNHQIIRPFPRWLGRDRGLSHRRPQKANEFTGDGHDRDGGPFAVPDQMPIASMQPLLGAPGMAHHSRWLSFDPVAQRAGDAGPVAIMPGGFDEHAPQMRVAGLGDRAVRPSGATRMF